jgi:hypothetical protein
VVFYYGVSSLKRNRSVIYSYKCYWASPARPRADILWPKSHRNGDSISVSHLRLDSLFVASYDSQDYDVSILTPFHTGWYRTDFKVILRPTVSRPVCPGMRPISGTRYQFVFLFHGNYLQIFPVFEVWAALSDKKMCL